MYDEMTCFWCGKYIANQKAYFSLRTDTLQTRRSFCTEEHLIKFKEFMKTGKPIRPYIGKE